MTLSEILPQIAAARTAFIRDTGREPNVLLINDDRIALEHETILSMQVVYAETDTTFSVAFTV